MEGRGKKEKKRGKIEEKQGKKEKKRQKEEHTEEVGSGGEHVDDGIVASPKFPDDGAKRSERLADAVASLSEVDSLPDDDATSPSQRLVVTSNDEQGAKVAEPNASHTLLTPQPKTVAVEEIGSSPGENASRRSRTPSPLSQERMADTDGTGKGKLPAAPPSCESAGDPTHNLSLIHI